MGLKIEQLNIILADIEKTILDILICSNNLKRITKGEDANEIQYLIKMGFFEFYAYQLRFILVIQLSKLLVDSRNQKLNFHLLSRKLASSELESCILDHLKKMSIDRSQLQSTVSEIEAKLGNSVILIANMKTQRDKFYAHKDIIEDYPLLSINELCFLSELCLDVFNSLIGLLNNVAFSQSSQAWAIDPIMRQLSKYIQLKYQVPQYDVTKGAL